MGLIKIFNEIEAGKRIIDVYNNLNTNVISCEKIIKNINL